MAAAPAREASGQALSSPLILPSAPSGALPKQKVSFLEKASSSELWMGSVSCKAGLLNRSRSNLHETLKWLEGEDEHAPLVAGPQDCSASPQHEASEAALSTAASSQLLPQTRKGSGWTLRLRPLALFLSLVASTISMLLFQRSLVRRLFGGSGRFTACVLLIDGAALSCMLLTAFADPGQLGERDHLASLQDAASLPKRAHKNFMYERPVRRFDHYCRWVTNCIGLWNHREFFVMVVAIVAGASLGLAVDVTLLLPAVYEYCWLANTAWGNTVRGLLAHGAYSCTILYFAVPILRLHIGFVARNELAAEWKRDEYWVLRKSPAGEAISVNDLDVDEYNEFFDDFQYDRWRNPFDQGWILNCWVFWCRRRSLDELGEF